MLGKLEGVIYFLVIHMDSERSQEISLDFAFSNLALLLFPSERPAENSTTLIFLLLFLFFLDSCTPPY